MYIVAYLNEYYSYPKSKKKFKLVRTTDYNYYFECGHWCTDNVFVDLIRVKTGERVGGDNQLELFTESQ